MPSIQIKSSKLYESVLEELWLPDKVEEEEKKPVPLARRIFNGERAQFFKLLSLLFLAIIHVFYMNSFIASFSAYEHVFSQVEDDPVTPSSLGDLVSMHNLMRQLVQYKKNLWVTVGAMCASLATSTFILLLLDLAHCNRFVTIVVRLVDLSFFLSLPILLVARRSLAISLRTLIGSALDSAHRQAKTDSMVNALKCSIVQRENLAPCSDVMVSSIFPVKVLEYLIILCVLTGAYMALAYLIDYCIRHWFPPTRRDRNADERIQHQPLVLPSV